MNPSNQHHKDTSFSEFLIDFKAILKNVFHAREDMDKLSASRGLPPYVLREIMSCNPLSVFIPKDHFGRGGDTQEGIALVEAAAYESLALGLVFGINWALFIQPVTKYAREEVKKSVFSDFLENQKMGGLMITEPDYGSDALHMQTSWIAKDRKCHLKGVKHWAGLTGWADYWLLTARKSSGSGTLARDIDFFVCNANLSEQRVHVEEVFQNLGLYMIPYGRSRIDVKVPESYRLMPSTTGIKMMLDLLHRSRMQFPGMAMGFLSRILEEAVKHCRSRIVTGKPLLKYDNVQARLSRIQSAFTICSAMCVETVKQAGINKDLASQGLEANAIKAFITDAMHDSAQSLMQLTGAKGYRLDSFAGRAVIDSRPFKIFEGSNDILYAQIGESVLKKMKVLNNRNFCSFLITIESTKQASRRLKKLLDFEVDFELPQRKILELGKIVSRIIAMDLVERLGNKGFLKELIDASLACLEHEITSRLVSYSSSPSVFLVDIDQPYPTWQEYS
jgi:alkylation response protein AidB-like acyl-CoA dehydrogenase